MDIATFIIASLNPPQQHEEYKAVLAGWQAYFDRLHMIVPKEKHAEFERILQERMARKNFTVDAPRPTKTMFRCSICGKLTAGRIPVGRNHNERGDGTFRYPRKHNDASGLPCYGNNREAAWVEVEIN